MTLPKIIKTQENIKQTICVNVIDEYGEPIEKNIACERALTVYLNWREIVTLMTLGAKPELLVLGYLKNQALIHDREKLDSVIIDWETQSAAVVTAEETTNIEEILSKKTVTSGCGQGTMFGHVMAKIKQTQFTPPPLKQSTLYALLRALTHFNETYKAAGAVHGCAVCKDEQILSFVEDIGRHNAVDTLTGEIWLKADIGQDKIFYTTGRLTSEMVIKVAQMEIPILISRSGVTQMGYELAQQLGIIMIARAKGERFQVFTGAEHIIFDVKGS